MVLAALAMAQNPAPVAQGAVRINLKGETPLLTLVEYVSQRTNIRFFYDETIAQKKINLQVPDDIPVESLLEVLQSALQINSFALAESDTPGWYRIVSNDRIPQVAVPQGQGKESERFGPAIPITQVFTLKRGDPNQIKTLIQPFLTSPGANSIALAANKTLIVTDIAANIRRLQYLIDLLDAEQASSSIRFEQVKHVSVEDISVRLKEILDARARADGSAAPSGSGSLSGQSAGVSGIEIAADTRTSQLILIGLPSQIDAAITILKSLDVPLPTTTQTYRPQFLSPAQFNEALSPWIASLVPRPPFESRIEGAALIVTTVESLQQQIARLLPQIDSRETKAKQSPIRFYEIKNVPVQDILETLNSLQSNSGITPFQGGRSQNIGNRSRTTNDRAIPGQNNAFVVNANSAQPGLLPPAPPAASRNGLVNPGGANGFPGVGGLGIGSNQGTGNIGNGIAATFGGVQPLNPYLYSLGINGGGLGGFPGANGFDGGFYEPERGIQSPLGNAQVTADLGSNTLIIIAQPEVQEAYQQLIEFLDKRRPQVMIEARIVIIDTTDDFTLGVEMSGGDRVGTRRLFSFSSYGLSTVTPSNGALAITPGTGFNATLVDPSTADLVVRALASHRRARVLSSPKILVDDNAEGTLTSVNEVPFTSVNASQTVATTSFAGFAQAGTTITVTPTISEGKHVNLDYIVTLNSFTGTGSAGVPPPRQTNEISSRVTVPDGYTIIVGGLTQKNVTSALSGIPILENIPIVRDLTSLTSKSNRDNSLFVFLRPIILEEDQFRDLRTLSKHAANHAGDGFSYPGSSPLLMK